MPRRQFCNSLIDGLGRGYVAVEQEIAYSAALDFGLSEHEECLEFRCERNAVGQDLVIQGLDAEPVAHQQQPSRRRIPKRKREHPCEILERCAAVVGKEPQQRFSITGGVPRPVQRPA